MSSTIYIIYNAKGSFTGKLNYAYRKLTTPASSCAACDLTHGGLRLTETAAWTATKQQIGAVVRQLHIDELDSEIVDYATTNSVRYPVVLGRKDGGQLKVLLATDDLATCSSDHSKFLELLRAKAAEEDIPLNGTTPSKLS